MKILHYALGFPPYRSGGLTKYSLDLMCEQQKKGHEVAMMWPGRLKLTGRFVRFKRSKNRQVVAGEEVSFDSIEMINPIPVPLDEGIKDTDVFMEVCMNPEVFKEFFEELKPDVIHVHTLMGLYPEMIATAKKIGIRTVFTSHDYYGICPKVTLFRDGDVCDGNCNACVDCNDKGLSLKQIQALQSPTYRKMKNTKLVKAMRKKHRDEFFEGESENNQKKEYTSVDGELSATGSDYQQLRNYYLNILKNIDQIHFNSSVTESVYRKYLPIQTKGKVINLTHSNIKDERKIKTFDRTLSIAYLAPTKEFKGFNILQDALDELWSEGQRQIELELYHSPREVSGYMKVYDGFEYNDLREIFERADMLIMPSVWYETYGFTVLEALSFGVPVLVTNRVGSKDLLNDGYFGMIIKPTKDDLKQAISYIVDHQEILELYNERIVNEFDLDRVMNSVDQIEELYK